MIKVYYTFANPNSDEFIKKSLLRYSGKSDFIIKRTKNGKPYTDGLYFSLSHTKGLTICAVSDSEVGIDAEKLRPVRNGERIVKRFLGKCEKNLTDEAMLCIWTQFESKIKFFGEKIISCPKAKTEEVHTETFFIDDFIVSVCSKNKEQIEKEKWTMAVLRKADIMLPKNTDLTKWSVVACDQYTSQPEYWEKAQEFVGDSPSTLNLVYPEAFLSQGDSRIEKINKTMQE